MKVTRHFIQLQNGHRNESEIDKSGINKAKKKKWPSSQADVWRNSQRITYLKSIHNLFLSILVAQTRKPSHHKLC